MDYTAAISSSGVLDVLRDFDPRVVGTFPLGLAVAESDIDIVCHASDPACFANLVWSQYRGCDGFRLRQWTGRGQPVIASFTWRGFPFELFGDPRPVDQQPGWRHLEIERRLLALDDGRLRAAVMRHRQRGMKTEPAFAAVLRLADDPYQAMLALAAETDAEMVARLATL